MAVSERLTVRFASALFAAAFFFPSAPLAQEKAPFHLLVRVNLYEAFSEKPKGVFVSFHPKAGTPAPGGVSEQERMNKTASPRMETLQIASAEFVLPLGKMARLPVAYFSHNRASRFQVEVVPFLEGGNAKLDAQLIVDGREFFHASVMTRLGKKAIVGSGPEAGRSFILSLEASEAKEAAVSAILPAKWPSPARWPVYPEAARAAGKEASMLLYKKGADYETAGDIDAVLLQDALAVVKTWGGGVAFVHFRAGK